MEVVVVIASKIDQKSPADGSKFDDDRQSRMLAATWSVMVRDAGCDVAGRSVMAVGALDVSPLAVAKDNPWNSRGHLRLLFNSFVFDLLDIFLSFGFGDLDER
jgi:hypothetical protein